MRLPRERDRGERECGEHEEAPLGEGETEREQEGDRPEQVAGALRGAVGREREGKPADERGAPGQPEFP